MTDKQLPPALCRECGFSKPVFRTRDVEVTCRGKSITVENVTGWFCASPNCQEIEFDESTDSLNRWAKAGDALVVRTR